MSNQDRLLSDEELANNVEELVNSFMYELPSIKTTEIGWERIGEQEKELRDKIFDLINTQKRLYAESERLNAKEELLQGWLSWVKSGGGRIIASQIEESLEEIRAEQRARIGNDQL